MLLSVEQELVTLDNSPCAFSILSVFDRELYVSLFKLEYTNKQQLDKTIKRIFLNLRKTPESTQIYTLLNTFNVITIQGIVVVSPVLQ